MCNVRDERARPLNAPQQPMGDQLTYAALHRESGHVELLAELVLGRNPILGLQIARLQLMQDLVLDLHVSRLSHCFCKCCLWCCSSEIRFTYKTNLARYCTNLSWLSVCVDSISPLPTAVYIEALLVDEELADQVWGAWYSGADDQVAWLAWWLIAGLISHHHH